MYNWCTPQGPWVKSYNCPVTKELSWAYNTMCTSELGILHGSGANCPGLTIQVSHNSQHCAHTHNSTSTTWEEESTTMASQASTDGSPQAEGTAAQGLINMHRYKMQPTTFTGEYGTFEEWQYKFQAYMGLMDNKLPQLLEKSESATSTIREADFVAVAENTHRQTNWYHYPQTWGTS